jgi:hypothetical protein
MNSQKWLLSIIAVVTLVIVLVGFLYLQDEITGLREATPAPTPTPSLIISPTPSPSVTLTPVPNVSATITPLPTTTPSPSITPSQTLAPSPSPTPVEPWLPSSISTTTHGGTTLVCNGSLSIDNDGGPIFYINWINITNVGTATAYGVNIRIQAYYPDGRLASNVTHIIDASGMYAMGIRPSPLNIAPGQTANLPNSGRYDAYEVYGVGTTDTNIMGNYTIIPVWSNTPT